MITTPIKLRFANKKYAMFNSIMDNTGYQITQVQQINNTIYIAIEIPDFKSLDALYRFELKKIIAMYFYLQPEDIHFCPFPNSPMVKVSFTLA